MGTFLQTLLLKLILSVTTQRAVFKPFLSAFMEIMKNLEQTVEEKNQEKHYQQVNFLALVFFFKKKKENGRGFQKKKI